WLVPAGAALAASVASMDYPVEALGRGASRVRARRPRWLAVLQAATLRLRFAAASFSASVRVAPCIASRSISAALYSTRLPIRMGRSFPVRCNQKSVVSPIFRSARASARVNRRGPIGSFVTCVVSKSLLPSETRRKRARRKEAVDELVVLV